LLPKINFQNNHYSKYFQIFCFNCNKIWWRKTNTRIGIEMRMACFFLNIPKHACFVCFYDVPKIRDIRFHKNMLERKKCNSILNKITFQHVLSGICQQNDLSTKIKMESFAERTNPLMNSAPHGTRTSFCLFRTSDEYSIGTFLRLDFFGHKYISLWIASSHTAAIAQAIDVMPSFFNSPWMKAIWLSISISFWNLELNQSRPS